MKNYRKMLEDVGGWDNELVSIPAGSVRAIIEDLENTQLLLREAMGWNWLDDIHPPPTCVIVQCEAALLMEKPK